MVVKHRVQGIETINKAIVGIDNSSLEEKIRLRITMKRFTKRLWDIVCNILLRPGVNIYTMEEILWKKNLKFRPADVLSDFQLFKMSFVSLNKLPFLYCHDESLTINISHKAQDKGKRFIDSCSKEYDILKRN